MSRRGGLSGHGGGSDDGQDPTGHSGQAAGCSEAGCSSAAPPLATTTGAPRPRAVPIFVQAFNSSEDEGSQQADSVDCAVEVQVVVQAPPRAVKAPSVCSQQQPGAPPAAAGPAGSRKARSRAHCCALSLLVLGLVVAGVLVPLAVTVGLKRGIPPAYRVLAPPAPAARLVFAFQGGALVQAPSDALPPHLADRVLSWAALPSSGVHVAAFADAAALQDALAALSAAAADGSGSSSHVLTYALSDFRLLPDRRLTHLVDPMELYELARSQSRQLQQQNAQVLDMDAQDVYLLRANDQQQQQQQQQTGPAAAPRSTALAAGGGRPASTGRQRRRLLQDVVSTPAPLQMQQRQAQLQVQRGGGGVAWHLTSEQLAVQRAWNVTTGLDRVVVAVLDSGVELASGGVGPSIWANAAEVAADGVDNDGNGYVDDVMGWDFGGSCADAACSRCLPGPDPTDTVGWGTHAAAVVAAQPEVAAGTAGIAPGVRLMPLKVAECRAGSSLWNTLALQQAAADSSGSGGSSSSDVLAAEQQQRQQEGAGPVLLGSAAVQGLDYALVNGAHIVLAAWQAGEQLDLELPAASSNSSNSSTGAAASRRCFVGPAAAEQLGLTADAAHGGTGCVAAAQRLLFADTLKPLQEAGVLVVSMQAAASANGSSADQPPPQLPCSLSCELDNVLCVAAGPAPAPPAPAAAGSRVGVSDGVSALEFFRPLLMGPSSARSSRTEGAGEAADDDDGESSHQDSSSNRAGTGGRLAALQCGGGSAAGASWAQLSAPGSDILAGWAWGAHATVSGGSAAASVAAGAAALAWSQLGQALGAEASAAALEGLGQQVKQMLLDGSTITTTRSSSSSSSDSSGSSAEAVHLAQHAGGLEAAPAAADRADALRGDATAAQSSEVAEATPRATAAGSTAGPPAGAPLLALDVLGSLQRSMGSSSGSSGPPPAAAAAPLVLSPTLLPPSTTVASRGLQHSWYISNDESGRFDTNSMWFVSRRTVRPPAAFPITSWEFFGATSVLELSGHLAVSTPGLTTLAVLSSSSYAVWLQDKALQMARPGEAAAVAAHAAAAAAAAQGAGGASAAAAEAAAQAAAEAAAALPPSAWVAAVNFTAPGYFRLRVMVYNPSKPFDLQCRPPGSSSFASVTQLLSFGQVQPLPAQLLGSTLLPLAARGDSSTERSPARARAVAAKQQASNRAAHSSSLPANAASSPASQSSSRPVELPVAPGGSSTSSLGGAAPVPDSDSSSTTLEPPEEVDSAAEDDAAAVAAAAANNPFLGGRADSSSGWVTPFGQPDGSSSSDSVQAAPGADADSFNGGGGVNDFLASLRGMFGGFWGRRRRLLAAAPRQQGAGRALAAASGEDRGGRASATGSSLSATQLLQQEAEHYDRRLLAAAAAGPPGSSSEWGRFSVALSLADKTPYRTLMPPLGQLAFSHTGIVAAPGLAITSQLQLQQQVLGYSDPADNRGCYGMVQGWLDWRDLNPEAAAAIAAAAPPRPAAAGGAANRTQPAAPRATGTATSSSSKVATEGAGAQAQQQHAGGVQLGSAGVQFELSCDSCSLHIDGMTVAGSLGQTDTSACVTPVQWAADGGAAATQQQQRQLVHLQVLFTSNDVRQTRLQVRARPCQAGAAGSADGSWAHLTAAGARPPAFGLSAAAVAASAASGSGDFLRGMLCSLRADVAAAQEPAPAAPDSSSNGTSNGTASQGGSSTTAAAATPARVLHRSVFLTAEDIRRAVQRPVDPAEDGHNATAAVPAADAGSASGPRHAPPTRIRSTVDTPGSEPEEGEGSWEAGGSSGNSSSSNSSSSSSTTVETEEDRAYAELQLQRAAQLEAARAAAMSRGISVAALAPDWVAELPGSTQYALSCACFWNGSWAGNVSVGVTATVPAQQAASGHGGGGSSSGGASSGGSARLFVAGWPVATKPLSSQLYGPSDVEVAAYSTWLQRRQLESGSTSADPLTDSSQLWAAGLLGGAGGDDDGDEAQRSGPGAVLASLVPDAAAVLPAAVIRTYRQLRLQQAASGRVSRSGGSGGSGSVTPGLLPVGSLDGVSRRAVPEGPGWMQLLVLQASGLAGDGQVVVLAPGGDILAASTSSSQDSSVVTSSWLPDAWDAWVPAA